MNRAKVQSDFCGPPILYVRYIASFLVKSISLSSLFFFYILII